MEDVFWLSKEADHSHINIAELEVVAWGFKSFMLTVDSLTVMSWVGAPSMHAVGSKQKAL